MNLSAIAELDDAGREEIATYAGLHGHLRRNWLPGVESINYTGDNEILRAIDSADVDTLTRITCACSTNNVLYARFRDGDQNAFRVLVQRHHALLVRRVVDWGVDPATAEDIASQVFAQLRNQAHKFDETNDCVIGWMNWLADNRSRKCAA